MTTGQKIRALRRGQDMTQKELAEKLGYANHSVIVKIEKDEVDLPLSKVNAIARALGVKLSDILGDDLKSPQEVTDEQEQEVIKLYRESSPECQNAVLTLLAAQLGRNP